MYSLQQHMDTFNYMLVLDVNRLYLYSGQLCKSTNTAILMPDLERKKKKLILKVYFAKNVQAP